MQEITHLFLTAEKSTEKVCRIGCGLAEKDRQEFGDSLIVLDDEHRFDWHRAGFLQRWGHLLHAFLSIHQSSPKSFQG